MAKVVELRRHTESDGDVLTEEGIRDALRIGRGLSGPYHVVISSGAQRATQTIACFLATLGQEVSEGVRVDASFRSEVEDRWRDAYKAAEAGDLDSFKRVDPRLVESESRLFGGALKEVFAALPEEARALVVGHSPMTEAAVLGLTGVTIPPLSKGAGVAVIASESGYEVRSAAF